VIGGWSTNTIIDWSSGFPYSVLSGTTTTGRATLFPLVITRARFDGDPTSTGGLEKGPNAVTYLSEADRARFGVPGAGEYGAGRNIFTGPGFFQTDFAIHKNFQITERFRFELRGELFNVFNNVNFNPPTTDATSGAFGVITSARVPPRIGQIAAKFHF
jgi:hypothetical protein